MSKKSIIGRLLTLVSLIFAMTAFNPIPSYGADEVLVKELKEKLILANKILDMENLAKPLGHISVRIPETENFLITRNVAPGMAVLEDIVVCNMEGKVIQGKYPRTFSEVVIHSGVYKKRKDIKSVTHTHSPYVIALSMTGTSLLPASFEAIELGPEPIATFKKIVFIDKPELGEEIADLLPPNKAVILKGHGAVVVGKSIEETTITALKLEVAAKLQLIASSAGKVASFTEQEKQPLIEFLNMVDQRGGTTTSYGRGWAYYESLMKK
jgi:ribulose-5-phosphate 4-epimerase/fuculose-1-phosphate aldolase